jgi:hypothetical protein
MFQQYGSATMSFKSKAHTMQEQARSSILSAVVAIASVAGAIAVLYLPLIIG